MYFVLRDFLSVMFYVVTLILWLLDSLVHHQVAYSAIKITITPTLAMLNTVEVE
jgi:hypothetical protein